MPSCSKLDLKADFSVQIQEQQHIQAILSSLDFKSGPPIPGGLYGYEQQRQIWNKVDRPLSQPYAAFSGGELITLAVEGLMQRYLGGALLSAIGDAERERAERAAREEVSRAINEYCGSRPDAGRSLHVCSVDSARATNASSTADTQRADGDLRSVVAPRRTLSAA